MAFSCKGLQILYIYIYIYINIYNIYIYILYIYIIYIYIYLYIYIYDKGSCVVVWDREDYIAEAEKQFSDKNVCRDVNSKSKTLQDLAETSNDIFKI